MSGIVYGYSLTPDAIESLGEMPFGDAQQCVLGLKNLWRRNGYLVVDSHRAHFEQLLAAIGRLQQQRLRDLLKQVLDYHRERVVRCGTWTAEVRVPSASAAVPPNGTWFVGSTEGARWGLRDEERMAFETTNGVEICRVDRFNGSRWAGMPEVRNFREGTPVADLVEAFRPLNGTARVLTVIDAYAGKDEASTPRKSGLRRFLEGLLRSCDIYRSEIRTIALYTATNVHEPDRNGEGRTVGTDEILKAWGDAAASFGNTSALRFDLHLVNNRTFRDIVHDRYVRFGTSPLSFCFTIGNGFGAFSRTKLRTDCAVGPIPGEDPDRVIAGLRREASYVNHSIPIAHESSVKS